MEKLNWNIEKTYTNSVLYSNPDIDQKVDQIEIRKPHNSDSYIIEFLKDRTVLAEIDLSVIDANLLQQAIATIPSTKKKMRKFAKND